MSQEQLKDFIQGRKDERQLVMSFNLYLEALKQENAIDDIIYKDMMTVLNNRFTFLEISIRDHKKLIK